MLMLPFLSYSWLGQRQHLYLQLFCSCCVLYPPRVPVSALYPFRKALLSNVRIGSTEACLLAMEGSRPGKAVMYLFHRGW